MRLRDVIPEDLPILFEQQCDPVAANMAAFAPRPEAEFMAHWEANVLADASVLTQTILVDDHVAGSIGCWSQADERLVGYWIGRAFWGRGVATAALRELLRREPVRPLHAYVATHNIGSIRVLQKCGFERIGDPIVGSDGIAELRFRLSGAAG